MAVVGQGVTMLTRTSTAAVFSMPQLNANTASAVDVLVNVVGRRVYVLTNRTLSFVDVAAGGAWSAAAMTLMDTLPDDGSQFTGLALAPSS